MMLNRIPVHQDKLWLVSLGSIKWTAQTVERNLYKVLCFYRVGRHKIEYCRESRERRQELTLIFHSSLLKMLWSRFIFVLILAVVSARPSPELSLEEIEKGKLSCKTEQLYRSLIILLCSLVYTGFLTRCGILLNSVFHHITLPVPLFSSFSVYRWDWVRVAMK